MSASESPRPWKVADIEHDYDIVDADGRVVARAAHGDKELAGFIVRAVNLHEDLMRRYRIDVDTICELIDERDRLREENERLRLALGEAEASAECNLAPEIDKLRDLVRRLSKRLSSRTLAVVCTPGTRGDETAPDYDLIDEARDALGESSP